MPRNRKQPAPQPQDPVAAPSITQGAATSPAGVASQDRFRDRVIELRRVRCGDIEEHPRNIRRHGGQQMGALAGDLAERGKTRPLISFPADGLGPAGDFSRLMFADGHGRRNLNPDEVWPVIVTDLTRAEADRDLFCDSIGEMAEYDPVALDEAIRNAETGCQELADMLERLWEDNKPPDEPGNAGDGETIGDVEYRVVVKVDDEHAQSTLIERLESEGFVCQPLMS